MQAKSKGRTLILSTPFLGAAGELAIDVSGYVPTDLFLGTPYLDQDEEVADPVLLRRSHGGFAGTDTRLDFYFPPKKWRL